MADFDYTSSGGVILGNCADYILYENIITKFAIGSSVYVLDEARKGKLENVVVKRVNFVLPSSSYRGFAIVINYVDTLNEVWLEDELGWQSEAVELAEAYYEDLIEKQKEATLKCLGRWH